MAAVRWLLWWRVVVVMVNVRERRVWFDVVGTT
jgi:hypothetical protein